MPRCVCAVFESSGDYVRKFSEYVKKNPSLPFCVYAFTDEGALEDFIKKNRVSLLLLPENKNERLNELIKRLKTDNPQNIRIAVLGDIKTAGEGMRAINKYQHAEGIISDIVEFLENENLIEDVPFAQGKKADITGIYSFVSPRRAFKAALDLEKKRDGEKNILYISLTRFSGIDSFKDTASAPGFSDLIYYFKKNPSKMRQGFMQAKENFAGADVLKAPENTEDLELIEDEWEEFINRLLEISADEKVIVDLTEGFRDLKKAFVLCSQIYLICERQTDKERCAEFKRYVESLESREIYEKVRVVEV